MLTESEQLFEQYCNENKIPCSRISESEHKTPDYKIVIDGLEVIAEIKQIEPNNEDKKLIEKYNNGKVVSARGVPGDKVRNMINKAAKQIAEIAKGKYSAIIVLYNNHPIWNKLDPYNIKVGMFGLQKLCINGEQEIVEQKFGPKQKLTGKCNTTVSAVAVLEKGDLGKPSVKIYHNHYAAIPLVDGLFRAKGGAEYRLSKKIPGEFQDWEEIFN